MGLVLGCRRKIIHSADEKQRKELEKHIAKLAIRDSDEQIAREILKVIG